MEIYERKPYFYVVYICKSPNFEIEVENVLHLLFYILKKEKAKKDVFSGKVVIIKE